MPGKATIFFIFRFASPLPYKTWPDTTLKYLLSIFLFPMRRFIFSKQYEITKFFYKKSKKSRKYQLYFKISSSCIKNLLEIVVKLKIK